MATELACPKCQASMRSYERNGIQIDQCTECRGIFLDRGELERLIDAESAFTQAARQGEMSRASSGVPTPGPSPDGYPWSDSGSHGKPRYGGHHGRRKSFLSELFD